ncbi:MAG: Mur ligase family protein, partial [Erysipelotrichia bacterium]|nr:Mur ligase family protein [Erysipelotrichia bacterium]
MKISLSLIQLMHKGLAKAGRGGSLPGSFALTLDRNFISRFKMPKIVIVVTGTNGKTTTSNLIAESLRNCGLKVINNHRGDNLNVGIATLLAVNSNSNYEIMADAAVIEVDELTLYRQFHSLHPTAVVVTNFFRDQLDRAGEMETIIRKLMEVTEDFSGDMILNGDDPNVLRLADNAKNAKVHLFSVGRNSVTRSESDEASEGKFCPRCGSRLEYEYYQYAHIGRFCCHYDHFGIISPEVLVTDVNYEKQTFSADGKVYHSFINAIYAIYNCAAVLCTLKSQGFDPFNADKVFCTYTLNEGRNEL